MKKQVQPNTTILPKVISITCPHCWFDFTESDALFIATHPELIGDEVLGEHHYKRIPHAQVKKQNGRYNDPKGSPVIDFACPKCRLQIPRYMLRKSPKFISLAGAPSAGKTYFITSLIHTLRQQLPQKFNLLMEYAISDEIERIEKLVDKLFNSPLDKPVYLDKTQESGGTVNNVITLNGQRVELPKPFLFFFRPTPNHINFQEKHDSLHQTLALYDCSGEHFQYGRYKLNNNRSFGHFEKANAVLFVYDPLQDSDAATNLSHDSKDPQLNNQKHTSLQEKTLEAVIQQLRILRRSDSEKRIQAPLLVVVQKYDVWHSLLPKWAQLDPKAILESSKDGYSGVHVDSLNRSSLHIRKFLFDTCPMFVSQAEANFETVRYFAVSAIGTSPQALEVDAGDEYEEKKETKLCVLPRNIHPFRVTDPILWLFEIWGLLPKATIKNTNKTISEAKVIQASDSYIKVILPDSKKQMILDNQYLGCIISDPFTGTEAKIPRNKKEEEDKSFLKRFLTLIKRLFRSDK